MPVYEFYCPDCHRIFNFMSRRMNTRKQPACPDCGRPKLDRKVSLFAVSKGLTEGGGELPDLDEAAMERAMASLAEEAERIEDDDPRQVARLMRKLYRSTGIKLGSAMEEAMSRMEAGEDPDAIEKELGSALEEEDPIVGKGKAGRLRRLRRKFLPPSVDEDLHDL
jgi:putative FmdB family regulatory protein